MKVNKNIEDFYRKLSSQTIKTALEPEDLSMPLSYKEEHRDFAAGVGFGQFEGKIRGRLWDLAQWLGELQSNPKLYLDKIPQMQQNVQDVQELVNALWSQAQALRDTQIL